MADILLVEDKDSLRQMLRLTLETAGHTVEATGDPSEAIRRLERARFRLVLTDLRMPGASGLDVLRAARGADALLPVVVMTAYGSIDEAVQAMKDGAYDFLQKPVDSRHLMLIVERALEAGRLRTENVLLREEYASRYDFPRIIGESAALTRAAKLVQQVARRSSTVLLLGESGTGKELFARAVHQLSDRARGPFVALNCAAIPETLIENELFGHERGAYTGADSRRAGKFELAHGGTLFLDEIGELPLAVQSKLLRALESGRVTRLGGSLELDVDVRVVAATNRDLQAAIAGKGFREDLYFRLAVFPVEIPPLRDREDDVSLLASYFAASCGVEIRGKAMTLGPEALSRLRTYSWPGNVRELRNCLERACILADADEIRPQDLDLRGLTGRDEPVETLATMEFTGSLHDVSARAVSIVERRMIGEALTATSGNRTKAAERLGVSAKTLTAKIRELGL
ncbi:MAG: sigma-54-dependent Fis family transcriptional regulator [Blastocatellia bacterium]|jgi:DNA-binding NtrC family response regulator|nr:sigma-54-dependent Fis family transcriptional regulator [Blastocatellia bacterium]